MTQSFEKDPSNQPEKDGRGRRVPEEVRNLIKNTYLDLIAEGKKGRDTSAQVITERIAIQYPDREDLLPSLQSVNKIIQNLRKELNERSPLDEDWSMSLWMKNAQGISRSDLPLILRVQKFMAMDMNHRMNHGLDEYRLSVREAKWVGPVYDILIGIDRGTEVDDTKQYFLRNLVSQVQDYSRRERAIGLIDGPVDSYDIDLELAWKDVGFPFSNKGYLQQTLYKEMRLIPDASIMPLGQEILHYEHQLDSQDFINGGFEFGDRRLSPETALIRKVLLDLLTKGIEVRVPFGTEDWRTAESREQWFKEPWAPSPEDLYGTHVEYVIDLDLLAPIWDFIKFESELSETDSHQVRVATAFWLKIKDRVVEMIKDPKIQEKLTAQ